MQPRKKRIASQGAPAVPRNSTARKNAASISSRQHRIETRPSRVLRPRSKVPVSYKDGHPNKHRRKSYMSHHLDSPIARQDIRLDITDLYVFPGETGTVFVIDLCHSIFGPIPAPGYHPEGMYEFKQTTRPMSCSLWRPTLPLVSVSAKNP
jgi:hypothetical protein